MIIIHSQSAQSASLSHNFNNPPALTVNAVYGAYVCEGTKYTSATTLEPKSKYYTRIVSCLDKDIPLIEDNEIILVRKIDVNTIGGLMRAGGVFIENDDFWSLSAKEDPNSDSWENYNGVKCWLLENDPTSGIERVDYLEITDFIVDAFRFVKEALNGGDLSKRMGKAYLYIREKLDESTLHKQYSCGLVCRKTEGEFVSDMYRDGRVTCTYDNKTRSITISSKHKIEGFSCREVAASFWGGDVWGGGLMAGSPRYRALGEGEFLKVSTSIVSLLSKI